MSGIFLPGIFLISFYSLLFNDPILHGSIWYLATRLPDLGFTLLYFGRLSHGQLSPRVWAALFPVYFLATVRALLYRKTKPKYIVTAKTNHGARELKLVAPQIIISLFGIFCLYFNLIVYGFSDLFLVSLLWVCLMLYWQWPIIIKAITGKEKISWRKQYSSPKTNPVY